MGDEDGDEDVNRDENEDGFVESGGEATKRKKLLHTVSHCPSLSRGAVQPPHRRRGVRRIEKMVSTTGARCTTFGNMVPTIVAYAEAVYGV